MKIGDTFAVELGGQHVADAVLEDVTDGRATLVIPPTRFVMSIRTALEAPVPEKETVMSGLAETPDETPAPAVQEQVAAATAEAEGTHNKELDSSAID